METDKRQRKVSNSYDAIQYDSNEASSLFID